MNKLLTLLLISFIAFACKDKSNTDIDNSSDKIHQVVSDTLPWSDRMAQSIILRHPKMWQTENDSIKKWNYKIGLLGTAMLDLYNHTNNETYYNYVKDYVNEIIDSNGSILNYEIEEYNIDQINSGKLLFQLYQKTNDPRYKTALDALRKQLNDHPRTPSKGFWHKKIYPNQMWLDGLYMGAPFYARYDVMHDEGKNMDDIVHQFQLIFDKTYDQESGLVYHAWDESKKMDWADKSTGLSPNFWSRSIGWYMMAIVDVLDYIPTNHDGRAPLINILNKLSEGIARHQDESGLWYQVTDMPDRKGNYLESSSSCMFTYAWAKGVRKGYLPNKYQALAAKAYEGIINQLTTVDEDGKVNITQVCKSAGLGGNPYRDGSFDYYINEPIKINNLHGTGPFILASIEMNK